MSSVDTLLYCSWGSSAFKSESATGLGRKAWNLERTELQSDEEEEKLALRTFTLSFVEATNLDKSLSKEWLNSDSMGSYREEKKGDGGTSLVNENYCLTIGVWNTSLWHLLMLECLLRYFTGTNTRTRNFECTSIPANFCILYVTREHKSHHTVKTKRAFISSSGLWVILIGSQMKYNSLDDEDKKCPIQGSRRVPRDMYSQLFMVLILL